jgi:chromosome segregation ATPase
MEIMNNIAESIFDSDPGMTKKSDVSDNEAESVVNGKELEFLKQKSEIYTLRLQEKTAYFERLSNDIESLKTILYGLLDKYNLQSVKREPLIKTPAYDDGLSLQNDISKFKNELFTTEESINLKYDELKRKVNREYDRLKEIEQKIFARLEQYEKTGSFHRPDLENIIDSKDIKINVLNNEIIRLKEKIANEEKKSGKIKKNLDENINLVKELNLEKNEFTEKINDALSENDELKNSLIEKDSLVNNLNNKLGKYELKYNELESDLLKLRKIQIENENTLKIVNNENNVLKNDLEKIKISFDEMKNNLLDKEKEFNEINDHKIKIEKELSDIQNQNKDYVKNNLELVNQIQDLKDKYIKIVEKNEFLLREKETAQNSVNELEELKKQSELRIIDLEKLNASLTNHLHEESDLVESLKTEISMLKNNLPDN